ncbi:MAG: YtxH domain-containing protein [Eubacteriales bacterium]
MSRSADFMSGVLLGTIIGGIAGILLAPESGKDTMEKLKGLSEGVADNVRDFGNEAMEQVSEYKEDLNSKVENLSSKVTQKVKTYKDNITDKLENMQDSVEDAMEEVETVLENEKDDE